MPLGTLERKAPSFFRQGPSALSRLVFYGALALFLMVADARFHVTGPLRQAVAVALYPLQWLMLQPVEFVSRGSGYFQDMDAARERRDAAERRLAQVALHVGEAEQLAQENAALRGLLGLRARLAAPALAAEVLHDSADPYSRRVVLGIGQIAGVRAGAPVLDAFGVLGQVTRVYPMRSEVTLLIDRDQTTPVLNVRTGARSVAYGDPLASHGGGMELRFTPGDTDVQEGDLLSTSGIDGVYPTGIPVARVVHVERRADATFARIYCAPLAQAHGARHVLVLQPALAGQDADRAPARSGP